MSYKATKRIVLAAVRGGRVFASIHDDLDLDLAQAQVDAAVEAMLADPAMFRRAVKVAGSPDAARATLGAFFGVEL